MNRKVAHPFCLWTNFVMKKSGILWIYGAFKTTGNSEKKFPTWNSELDGCSKRIFLVRELPVVLNSMKSESSKFPVVFNAAEVMLD